MAATQQKLDDFTRQAFNQFLVLFWPLIFKAQGRLHAFLMGVNHQVHPHTRVNLQWSCHLYKYFTTFLKWHSVWKREGKIVAHSFFLFFPGWKRGEVKTCISDDKDFIPNRLQCHILKTWSVNNNYKPLLAHMTNISLKSGATSKS